MADKRSKRNVLTRWAKLHRVVSRRPRLVFAAVLSLALGAAFLIPSLRIEPDGRRFLAPDHPVRRRDADIQVRFGLSSPVVVAIVPRVEQSRLSIHTLLLAQKIAHELGRIPDIPAARQLSLFSLAPTRASLLYVDWEELMNSALLAGLLLGIDGFSIVITLFLDEAARPRDQVLADIQAIVDRFDGQQDHGVYLAGAPVAETLLTGHILRDLALMIPLVMISVGLMLLIGLTSIMGMCIAMLDALLTLIFTAAAMVAGDVPIYLPTTVVPVLLVAIGVCDDLHLAIAFSHERAADPDASPAEAMERALARVRLPMVLTSLTTAAGLASFTLGELVALRSVGLVAAVGVLVSMALSLSLVPALLVLLAGRRPITARQWLLQRMSRLEHALSRARVKRAPTVVLICVLAAAAMWRLQVQDSWLGNFDPESKLRRTHEIIEERIGGTHRVLLELDGQQPGAWYEPGALTALARLEHTVCARPEVALCLSPASLVREVQRFRGQPAGIPASASQVRDDLAALDGPAAQHLVRTLITHDGRHASIHVMVRRADYHTVNQLMNGIDANAAAWPPSMQPTLRLGGDAVVSHAMVRAVVRHQIGSLIGSLALAVLITALGLRSVKLGLVAAVPVGVTLAVLFAVMALARIPLGIATAMSAGVIVGVSIDYSIYALCRRVTRSSAGQAEVDIHAAIFLNSLVLATGLLVLLWASAPPLAMFGGLVSVSLVVAAVLAVWLIPP